MGADVPCRRYGLSPAHQLGLARSERLRHGICYLPVSRVGEQARQRPEGHAFYAHPQRESLTARFVGTAHLGITSYALRYLVVVIAERLSVSVLAKELRRIVYRVRTVLTGHVHEVLGSELRLEYPYVLEQNHLHSPVERKQVVCELEGRVDVVFD